MRRNPIWGAAAFGILALALSLWAEARKPGLWEMTTVQTWQQSPIPPGSLPAGAPNPFNGAPHTTQVCLTRQQIDKYGAVTPKLMPGCQITNLNKTAAGMTADMVCTGRFSGKGTMESTAIDSEHAKGKVHFTGTMQMGPNSRPVEWTVDSTSVFRSADCGSVKPFNPPEK